MLSVLDKVKVNENKSRKVIQLSKTGEHIKTWNSVSEAAEYYNLNTGSIWRVCNGERKTHGGYKWIYEGGYNKCMIKESDNMKKDRSLLEQNLIKPTLEIKRKRSVVRDIKKHLYENYAIFEGSVQSWINDPSNLKNVDTRILFLFAEQIYIKTEQKYPNINPEEYFTEAEIKTARQYDGKLYINNEVEFPIIFQPAIQHSYNTWTTRIHIKTLVSMLQSRLIHWNPESQREATLKIIDNEVIPTPTIYMKNVLEMKELLKKNKLEISQIILNASAGTSDVGEEVVYDESNYELKILSAKIDVIDGYHRILASQMALSEKPDIDFWFDLKLVNMSVSRAAELLAQISKATPISETKRRVMGKESFTDKVISELRSSKLGDKISKKENLSISARELVTYKTLSKGIESNFKITKTSEMYDVADYLIEFFDVLLDVYEDEFINNYHETKKKSLINDNNIIGYGYILLASRMKKENIPARSARKYIRNIDFSRENEMWKELGVLDNNGNLTRNPRVGIEKLFNEINL
jgi:hypothetical protein